MDRFNPHIPPKSQKNLSKTQYVRAFEIALDSKKSTPLTRTPCLFPTASPAPPTSPGARTIIRPAKTKAVDNIFLFIFCNLYPFYQIPHSVQDDWAASVLCSFM